MTTTTNALPGRLLRHWPETARPRLTPKGTLQLLRRRRARPAEHVGLQLLDAEAHAAAERHYAAGLEALCAELDATIATLEQTVASLTAQLQGAQLALVEHAGVDRPLAEAEPRARERRILEALGDGPESGLGVFMDARPHDDAGAGGTPNR